MHTFLRNGFGIMSTQEKDTDYFGPQIERKAALTAAELRAVLAHLPNQVDAMTHSDSNFVYSSLSPQHHNLIRIPDDRSGDIWL